MFLSTRSVAALAIVALIGAGCQPKPPAPTTQLPPGDETTVPVSMGFGKLPDLDGSMRQAGNVMMNASVNAGGMALTRSTVAKPMMAETDAGAPGMTTPSAAPATSAMLVRPLPMPPGQTVSTEYTVSANLPDWNAEGAVLEAVPAALNASAASGLITAAGLPSAIAGTINTLSSVNAQWRDRDGGQWNFDAGSRYLSYWKETAYDKEPSRTPPSIDEAAVVRAADAFLNAHGLSAIAARGGKVIDLPRITPLMDGDMVSERSSMPCILLEDTMRGVEPGVSSGGGTSGSSGSAVAPTAAAAPAPPAATTVSADAKIAPMIYPSPCGDWWPQVTVMYAGTRDGQAVSDPYGNDADAASVTVHLGSLSVAGLNLQLESPVNRSSYPLISKEDALKRLQNGGRNPILYWGERNEKAVVTIKTVELVWMRYDSWESGQNETYYLPALRGIGTVTLATWPEAQEYRTVVPLVADEAFDGPKDVVMPVEPLPAEAPAVLKMQ